MSCSASHFLPLLFWLSAPPWLVCLVNLLLLVNLSLCVFVASSSCCLHVSPRFLCIPSFSSFVVLFSGPWILLPLLCKLVFCIHPSWCIGTCKVPFGVCWRCGFPPILDWVWILLHVPQCMNGIFVIILLWRILPLVWGGSTLRAVMFRWASWTDDAAQSSNHLILMHKV